MELLRNRQIAIFRWKIEKQNLSLAVSQRELRNSYDIFSQTPSPEVALSSAPHLGAPASVKQGQLQEIWLAWAFVWQLPDSCSRNRSSSSIRAPPQGKKLSWTQEWASRNNQKICGSYRIENWYLLDLIKIFEPVGPATCPVLCIVSQCNQLFWCPSRPVWITPCTRTRWLS